MNKDQFLQRMNGGRNIQRSSSTNNIKMPSPLQLSKNLASSVVRNVQSVAAGNSLRLTTEQAHQRLSICNSCEFFNQQQQRCTKCGCYMAIKTYLKAEKCPVGKW